MSKTTAQLPVASSAADVDLLMLWQGGVQKSITRALLLAGFSASIADDAVTNAKLANMAANTVKANITGGTADPQDVGLSSFKTWLALAKADVGLGNVDNTSNATERAAAATLTNKTIDGGSNTLTNIAQASVSDLASDLAARLLLAGGTMTGALTLSADPTNALHAASKQYVDSLLLSLRNRTVVRAASTANINLASPGSTIDGVAMNNGELFMPKNQTAPAENGIYVWNGSASAATRAPEFDTWAEHPGTIVAVKEGTTNADTIWLCASNDSGTLGVTAINWASFSAAGALLAANNLSDVSNAGTARSNLGLAIGTNVQAYSAELTSMGAVSSSANKMLYATGAQTWALADLTAAARTLLDDTTTGAMLTTLGAAPIMPAVEAIATGAPYTLVNADNGKLKHAVDAAAQTINITTAFTADGCAIMWLAGAGTITLDAGAGVNLNGLGDGVNIVLSQAAGMVFISRTGAGAFNVTGAIGDFGTTDILGVTTARVLGRVTAGTGAAEELTAAQVRTLINVADGATANSSDATLIARANHTGTQTASTISDFSEAVDDRVGALMVLPTGAYDDAGNSLRLPYVLCIGVGDETTALTTGAAKFSFHMPFSMALTGISAGVVTAPTGADLICDVNDAGSTIMTTNKLRIDATELSTHTAATPPTLTDTALAKGALVTIDIDQIGSTVAGAGLKVYLVGFITAF